MDASGALPDGTKFDGVAGLRQLIASHQDDFARTFTREAAGLARGGGVWTRAICRRCARSLARRRATDIDGRRSFSAVDDEHAVQR